MTRYTIKKIVTCNTCITTNLYESDSIDDIVWMMTKFAKRHIDKLPDNFITLSYDYKKGYSIIKSEFCYHIGNKLITLRVINSK